MFVKSELTGFIYTQEGVLVPNDDRIQLRKDFEAFIANNGVLESVAYVGNEQQVVKASEFMINLQSVAASLRIKAKAAAIGKTGTQEYIFSQVELYELKFKVASGIIVNAYITSLIENEAVEFGLPIQDFKDLIIQMYNTAKEKYEVFLFMIERCRTKIQTLIELGEFTKVETAFGYIGNLSDAAQAEQTMTNILAL